MFKAPILLASLLKTGLQNHVYRCNLLLRAYIDSGNFSDAQSLLHFMPFPNVVSYNTLLSGYCKFHLIDEALKLFTTAPETDSRSWNIVISGCIRNQRTQEAIIHFVRMRRGSIRPDNFTYTIVVTCCHLELGRQIHAEIIKICSNSDAFLGTNLLQLYMEVGETGGARKLFDEMPCKSLATWNALIGCYSKLGMGEISLQLFQQLVTEGGLVADEYTYAIVLNEFASRFQVFEAMQVHSLIIRCGFCSDRYTSNALVNLYSKCGFVASAVRMFDEMPDKDVVSWTAVIAGFSQCGQGKEAIRLFDQMQLADVEPNSFTFGCLLSACASANSFERGKQFHGLVLKFDLETDVVVGSAIIDMYSKCGEMDDALRVFQSMPNRDIVSWNGMICAFAQNGDAIKALKLFNEMVQSRPRIDPNHVTFVGVLSACSHCGLVKEGRRYFNDMINKYQIKPETEHYTCMIDILARAGLLEEAEAMIAALPFKADSVMWGALLGACKLHGNSNMAERVAERLYMDEPQNSSNYVLLANTYTTIGEWGDALDAREVMHARGTQKMMGCSWIEIRNCVHSFIAGDKYHPKIELLYELLQVLHLQMVWSHL